MKHDGETPSLHHGLWFVRSDVAMASSALRAARRDVDNDGLLWQNTGIEDKDVKLRNIVIGTAIGGVAIAGGLLALACAHGLSVGEAVELGAGAISAKVTQHTVGGRVSAILAKKPQLKEVAKSAGGKLNILVFKNERSVEVRAPGWKAPRLYKMTAFSGTLGPKLREGDRQIPEGIYGIGYLNPNSSYYLSLQVAYPNASDKARAKVDGRTKLGGDIMIHGKDVTIGCVPVGDDAIEDIFYLASAVGIKNVSVIIAPYDMRKGRKPELEKSSLKWYAELCGEIAAALKPFAEKEENGRSEHK